VTVAGSRAPAGAADPALVAALAAHLRGEASLDEVVDALRGARVLVPVVAHRDGRIPGRRGLPTDHESTAGIVALEAPDGRSVLPVFSSVETMAGWQADARPVPARADRAALESLTRTVNARLAASDVVSARVDSLELRLREVEPAEA